MLSRALAVSAATCLALTGVITGAAPSRAAAPAQAPAVARTTAPATAATAPRGTATASTSPSTAAAATAVLRHGGRVVVYAGLAVTVPASWPVYDLAAHPATCVRWDRHAVYLGTPGADQACPAHLVGRTEAVLVTPAATMPAGAAARSGAPTVAAAAGSVPATAVSTAAHQIGIAVTGTGAALTVTWGADPVLARAVAAGVTRRPSTGTAGTASTGTTATRGVTTLGSAVPLYPLGRTSTMLQGLAFDTCATPSVAAMQAWRRSSYRGVGVYIGGANRACGDGNLSASWLGSVVAHQGWKVLPIYVGLQAPCSSSVFARTSEDPGTAYRQGVAGAADAVAEARSFGLLPGSAVYDDMEGYGGSGRCSAGVLSYLSGWTSGLHGAGYSAGVYSSGASGIYDIGRNFWNTAYLMPDLVWSARWDGVASTTERNLSTAEFSQHQRLKQYAGDHVERFGGYAIDIDSDAVDAAVSTVGYRVRVRRATSSYTGTVGSTVRRRSVAAGAAVTATCWLRGTRGGIRAAWYVMTDGSWIPWSFLSVGGQTPPECGLLYTTWAAVPARRGPSTRYPVGAVVPGDNGAWVSCQVSSQRIRTSRIWDRLRSGLWVPDYYLNTPGHSAFSGNIPRC